MSVVQRRVVLTAPNPPAGFPGSPLESPSQPLTVAHLIAVNHYIKQLGLFLEITPTNPDSQTALAEGMLHQSRVVNAIVRDRYPEDLRDPGSQAQNNELALKIAEMVTAQMRPQLDELKQEFGQGKKELEGRLDRVDKQIGEMNKRLNGFDNRLESVNTRFDEVNKRFDDVDKRFDDVDKRFDDVDKRFDDVDKRFDDVYKRFDGVDKRFNDVDKHSNEVDKRFNDVSNRFDNVDQRSNDLNEQLTGLSSSLETTKADLIEQVSGVTQRLEGLEQATSDLRGSLELLSGNQDIRVVIKEVLDKELDEMKSDIRANTADLATLTNKFAGVEDLPGMEAAVHESQGQLKNLLDRVTRIERSNRLFVNHTRIADGPWVEIPNEEGKYPTNSPEKYKLLANNRALESLTGPALGKYLTFYALPFPTGVDDMTPRWSSEQKAEATSALRVYITSPA